MVGKLIKQTVELLYYQKKTFVQKKTEKTKLIMITGRRQFVYTKFNVLRWRKAEKTVNFTVTRKWHYLRLSFGQKPHPLSHSVF